MRTDPVTDPCNTLVAHYFSHKNSHALWSSVATWVALQTADDLTHGVHVVHVPNQHQTKRAKGFGATKIGTPDPLFKKPPCAKHALHTFGHGLSRMHHAMSTLNAIFS
jgi:hypothetical protein